MARIPGDIDRTKMWIEQPTKEQFNRAEGGRVDPGPKKKGLFWKNKIEYADSVLNANSNLDWVKRLYEKNPQTIQLPGEKYPSTHFMADNDKGYGYPTVVRESGQLKYLGDEAEDYARKTKTGIQLPKEQGDWFWRGGYKKGSGVLKTFEKGGKVATPGTSFKELINYATNKPNASREEFESSMAARGYKPSDIRKLGKAYERVSGSGNDYILHPNKGFNVFEGEKQLTGSGKKKGNKAGLDLGDLIGLGNDVSLLAGALRKELPGFEKSRQPKQELVPEGKAEAPTKAGTQTTATGEPKAAVQPEAATKTPSKHAPATKTTAQQGLPPVEAGAAKEGAEQAGRKGEVEKRQKANEEGGFDWKSALLGDIPLLWDTENYKALATAFNPAQFWSATARENAKNLAHSMPPITDEQGGLPNMGILTPTPGSAVKAGRGIKDFFKFDSPEYPEFNVHKKGGKLLYGADGIKAPKPFGLEEAGDNADFASFFNDGQGAATQSEIALPNEGTQEEKSPTVGADNKGRYGDLLSGLVKYGIPAAYLGAEQHQINHLRGLMTPKYERANLMTGFVQDLPHPDFSLPYQPDLGGSSLAESQHTGLAREKFTREGRINWEQQNALNKQQQRNQVLDRTNQATLYNNQLTNQEKNIGAGNAAREFAYLLGDRGITAGSLFQNLDTGIYGSQVAHDTRSLQQAQDIVRNPEKYSYQDMAWARKTLKGMQKMGGKMKKNTRFSKAAAY